MEHFDVIIVGAGAAGLTAGVFASRRGMRTLILSKDLGGQASTTPEVENYPGLDLIEGWDLMKKFESQAKKFDTTIKYEEVQSIDEHADNFEVTTVHEAYTSSALILAFGKTPNDLGVPGEEELKGKHIHYAALRDVSLYKGKTVAIIGGANTAAQSAITLSAVAKHVYLLVREGALRCEKILLDRLLNCGKTVEIIYDVQVKQFVGQNKLENIVASVKGSVRNFTVSDAFIGIGYSNKTAWVKHLVATDKIGQIIIQPDCSTSTPGIFASGDVTTIPYKQVVISAGEGAKAAIAAHNYVCKKQGKIAPNIDWGVMKSK